MENKKIVVTVNDGTYTKAYNGDLIHLNVFNRTEDGMEMNGETAGSNFVPATVVGGAAESVLNMITRMSRTSQEEQELLMVVAEKLVERMEQADKQEPEPRRADIHISGDGIKQLLIDILAIMEEEA